MKSGKSWGVSELIFNNDVMEVHRIAVLSGGYCSLHKHDMKWNMFYVEDGEIIIEVSKNDYDLVDKTLLKSGQKTTVKPGEYHRFRALKDTIAYEIYYTGSLSEDIIRKDHGGIDG